MLSVYIKGQTMWVQTKSLLVYCKGTPQKDVTIKSDAPDTLLLEKHADYIASYGSKKDDYVRMPFCWDDSQTDSYKKYLAGFLSTISLQRAEVQLVRCALYTRKVDRALPGTLK